MSSLRFGRPFLVASAAAWVAVFAGSALSTQGCSDADTSQPATSTTTSTGAGGAPTTSSTTGGMGGSGLGGAGDAPTTSAGGMGGSGGEGGGAGWPTCDAQPSTAQPVTIPQIWQSDPAQPVEVWVAGVIVTGVSRGGCTAGQACQIFLQQDATYASFDAGAQHGIKLFASASTAQHFTDVAVGDVVDVLGHAWRYDLTGQNELLVQVNSTLPGCAKVVGAANPQPITGVTLDELTLDAYENTHGPLLIQVAGVSGNPNGPTETFALWETGAFNDAGIQTVTSLSPFFITGATFTGLTEGVNTDFVSVTGVFGLFVPDEGAKYEEIYARSMADIVQ